MESPKSAPFYSIRAHKVAWILILAAFVATNLLLLPGDVSIQRSASSTTATSPVVNGADGSSVKEIASSAAAAISVDSTTLRKKLQRQQKAAPSSSPYAYAFLIGGCDVERPGKYLYFLNGIYVAIYTLKHEYGSTADFHVFVEMMHGSSSTLPDDQTRILRELGATFVYIQPQPPQSFYRTQLHKFRILGLTQYRKVMYLDSDVLPLASLDYLFELSDKGVLQNNIVLVGKQEPSNGGVFLLSPKPGDLKEINEIIQAKERRGSFDPVVGWGHKIVPPDLWVSMNNANTTWNFHGAEGDQGLLYHWTKYVKKDVSMILPRGGEIQNWSEGSNGEVVRKKTISLDDLQLPKPSTCFQSCNHKPRSDFVHFTAYSKPWYVGLPADYQHGGNNLERSPVHFWFDMFDKVNVKYELGLDLNTTFSTKVLREDTKHPAYSEALRQRTETLTSLLD